MLRIAKIDANDRAPQGRELSVREGLTRIIEVAQSSVAKYMVKRKGSPSQGWRTFLRNHAPDIAAMELFADAERREHVNP